MKIFLYIFLSFLIVSSAFAANIEINFEVGYKAVDFAGNKRQAITVNQQIPAPTLHFKEGDHVTINVHNDLDKETAIHWHGIILPWQMDGVKGVNQRGIQPGETFRYEFTLEQSGTYWYHAHAGLQEQEGLYGAIIIDPVQPSAYQYDKDYVVVLSDWSNTDADQILDNLKKEGDYYSTDFPLQPSLMKFIHDYKKASKQERQQLIDDYKMMQQMRMSIYDMSDVAYDAYLLNGQPNSTPWNASVKVGDVVRLRFIGAGGSTIFNVKIPGTTMQMVHVEGNDVKPYNVHDFMIAPGETYDVLVKIEKETPYIIYAESKDTLGAAYGALLTSSSQVVDYNQIQPFPEPLPTTREMMSMMMGKMIQGKLPSDKPKDSPIQMPEMGSIEQGSSSHNMDGMNMDSMNHGKVNDADSIGNMKIDADKNGAHNMNDMKMSPTQNKSKNAPHDMSDMKMGSIKNTTAETPKQPAMSESMSMSHDMNMGSTMSMNEPMSMDMPTESSIVGDTLSPPNDTYKTSSETKYKNLIAAVKTNDPDKPVDGVINMELFGYMERYIWFINGVPEHEAEPIVLEPNKRYRFVFTNTSMMHHPMHIHGHWFILRQGNDAYDPLLHTIDIPPGGTITADVDTDASGQWIFHCHLLYHMVAGMSREIQYSSLLEIVDHKEKPENIIEITDYYNRPIVRVDEVHPIDVELVDHPMPHEMGLWMATFADIAINPVTNVQRMNLKGLYGGDYNKLELFINDAEMQNGVVEFADMDIFYWRLLSQFWAVKAGANYFYRPAEAPYWQPGLAIEGLMPYFIDTSIRTYFYGGSAKFDMEFSRDSQMTNKFFIRTGIRSILATKTVDSAEIGNGLNQMRYIIRPYYQFIPRLNAFAEFEYEQYYGAFKEIQIDNGEGSSQTTLTFGVSLLF